MSLGLVAWAHGLSGCLGPALVNEPGQKSYLGSEEGFASKKHGKIIGKSWENTIIIIAFFGNVMVKLYLNNWFNGLIGFVRFGLV